MKEFLKARKYLVLGVVIAVLVLIMLFGILSDFGCFGFLGCGDSCSFWSCFEFCTDSCTDCLSCALGCE